MILNSTSKNHTPFQFINSSATADETVFKQTATLEVIAKIVIDKVYTTTTVRRKRNVDWNSFFNKVAHR